MKFKSIKHIRIWHAIRRIMVTFGMLLGIAFLIRVAPNYVADPLDKVQKLLINNTNVTNNLAQGLIIEGDNYYIQLSDIQRYFDNNIIISDDRIITTSSINTVAIYPNEIKDGKTKIEINGKEEYRENLLKEENGTKLIALNNVSDIYNFDIHHNEETMTTTIDSLDRKYVEADGTRNQFVRLKATFFSRYIERINDDEKFTIVQDENGKDVELNGYVRIRTANGKIGYINKKNVENENVVRETASFKLANNKQASIVWDYYGANEKAPARSGSIKGANVVSPSFYRINSDGSLKVNFTQESEDYVKWAHEQGYEVWPTVSNNGLNNLNVTSKLFSTYENRTKFIGEIVENLKKAKVDGVNIDIERMYLTDKDNYSRFIIELVPRLHKENLKLSVLVTSPDGSETWSLCYDRNKIGKTTDYLVYLTYDEQGLTNSRSICSYALIENNIAKFMGQEGVSSDKIVLALPFYTRLWRESGTVSSSVVNMVDTKIPSGVNATWDEATKQNYIEWKSNGVTYKEWIEDKDSISAKLDLVKKYNLAGAGFWEKDRETQDVWDVIDEKLNQ